jgi:hypothetical protein
MKKTTIAVAIAVLVVSSPALALLVAAAMVSL